MWMQDIILILIQLLVLYCKPECAGTVLDRGPLQSARHLYSLTSNIQLFSFSSNIPFFFGLVLCVSELLFPKEFEIVFKSLKWQKREKRWVVSFYSTCLYIQWNAAACQFSEALILTENCFGFFPLKWGQAEVLIYRRAYSQSVNLLFRIKHSANWKQWFQSGYLTCDWQEEWSHSQETDELSQTLV